ncbi:IS1 family transposase [Vibrio profundum]
MAVVDVKCRFCSQTDPVMKHGRNPRGIQSYDMNVF